MAVEDLERIGRIGDEIWNNGRLDLVDQIIAPEYVRHDPSFPEDFRGPEGYRQYVKALTESFSDCKVTTDDVIVAPGGDKIAMRWTWRATHTKEFAGIPATGKKIEVLGISIVRVENGMLVECWDGYDSLGIMRQLGAVA